MESIQYIGVDVAKAKFDIAFQGKHKIFNSDKKGLNAFVKWIKNNTSNPWVCMESTSIYSTNIAEHLINMGIDQVTIANPMQVKHFCKAQLLRNKNDKIDAKAIETFANTMPTRKYRMRSDDKKEINDLAKLISTLKKQVTQLQNQLETTQGKLARKTIKQQIKYLKKQIQQLEKLAKHTIKKNPEMEQNHKLITSIPGAGNLTAIETIACVNNINSFKNAKQFAAFAGLSPQQKQSGNYNGKAAMSKIGNPRLRRVLYMASLSAMRYNSSIKPLVQRLKMQGKPTKLIMGAVMRKLAHLIFAVLKHQKPFQENYHKMLDA